MYDGGRYHPEGSGAKLIDLVRVGPPDRAQVLLEPRLIFRESTRLIAGAAYSYIRSVPPSEVWFCDDQVRHHAA